ncbi:MAG: hypothetical protein ACE5GJ_05240 [Gemmatimonadota bacterium]
MGTLALAVTLAACGATEPSSPASVHLSVAAPAPGATLRAPAGMHLGITQDDGSHTLVLNRVAMVLREVELKKALDTDCDVGQEDDCEEFAAGPMVLELPLNGSVQQVVSVQVPPDIYDQIEFDIHKPDDDSPEDQAFLQAHPEFVDISILVEGTFDGESFVFTQDLNEEQEIDLVPPLSVAEGSGPLNLTLEVDVTTWFAGVDGTLVDPRTANKGEPNEGLVEFNIRRSIEVFEDDDRDGHKDDD